MRVAIGDINDDQRLDLVSANFASQDVSVLLGLGDGHFASAAHYTVDGSAFDVTTGDFDCDGAADVIATLRMDTRLAFLKGNGDGSFEGHIRLAASNMPAAIETADLDRNGIDDFVTTAASGYGVIAQRNFCALRMAIDIRPGQSTNYIKPDSRVPLAVAVLGSNRLDVSELDRSSLRFGPGEATPMRSGDGFEFDVNQDGFSDLLLLFRTNEAGLSSDGDSACLRGQTIGGTPLEGCDNYSTALRCGLGFEVTLLLASIVHLRRLRHRLSRTCRGS